MSFKATEIKEGIPIIYKKLDTDAFGRKVAKPYWVVYHEGEDPLKYGISIDCILAFAKRKNIQSKNVS